MKLLDYPLVSLLFILPLIHLLCAPYTKVEESFNLQATHDILVYGTPYSGDIHGRLTETYDHFTFPGVVPRTFIGPVLISGLSQPLIALFGFGHAQFIVRAVLGALNVGSLLFFGNALASAYGAGVARWWAALFITQFHVIYYLTRTLPNMYAFGLTTLAFAFLLPKSSEKKALNGRKQAICLLTMATAVFRSELAILLTVTGLYLLVNRQISLRALIVTFLLAFGLSLGLSVPIDSYFWQKWLWPELWAFYYNAIQGSSSNWGVSPWHYYFTSALPRLLINPLAVPLILLALYQPGTSRQARQLLIPSLLFITIYSIQPHKETRFIFYVVPPVTAAAALGANFLAARNTRTVLYTLSCIALVISVPLTLFLSTLMLQLSSLNYPGGEALSYLQTIILPVFPDNSNTNADFEAPAVFAHADVLTCMTGLTLFNQNPMGLPIALATPDHVSPNPELPLLLIDKTESNVTLGWPSFWERFEYALLEKPALALGNWYTMGVIQGYDGIEILRPDSPKEQDSSEALTGENNVLGLGAAVASVRRRVRELSGGWWIGPRMSNRIRIMRQFELAPPNV